MAKPNAGSSGMAMVLNSCPPPGNLIAMGCSMRHVKDIIQILKPAKKIINLMKASFLLYFSPPSQLDCPQNDGFVFPQRSSTTARSIVSTLSFSGVNVVVIVCNR